LQITSNFAWTFSAQTRSRQTFVRTSLLERDHVVICEAKLDQAAYEIGTINAQTLIWRPIDWTAGSQSGVVVTV